MFESQPQADSFVNSSIEIESLLVMSIQNEDSLGFTIPELTELDRGQLLNAVGMKLFDGFKRMGSVDRLNRAISSEKRAVALHIFSGLYPSGSA